MKLPSFVAYLLGIYFFLAGCVQVFCYVSAAPANPMSVFLHGLFVASWPFGVAAVIFALLEIRLNQGGGLRLNLKRDAEDDEPEIPEAPVQARGAMPIVGEQVSYFNIEQAPAMVPMQPAAAPVQPQMAPTTVAAPATPSPSSQLFATPPPFQQVSPSQQASMSATVPLDRLGAAPKTPPPGQPIPAQAAAAQPQQQTPPTPPGAKNQDGLSFFKV